MRYDANGCGGVFSHVCERFATWKCESPVYRPERRMFDGRNEVRELKHAVYAGPERARCVRRPIRPRAVQLAAEGRTRGRVT
ncbi:hypothetical protein DIE15_00420 [Burkholderia sp. Bp9031]|nr:hypothetical protein DIE15_00420 [Burkholderia sp. Bp9031]